MPHLLICALTAFLSVASVVNGERLSLTEKPSQYFAADKFHISGGVVDRADDTTPLVRAFESVHFESTLNLLNSIREGVDEVSTQGESPLLSGNLAGGFHYGRWVELARPFDYLNVEFDVAGLAKSRNHFLAIAKLAESVASTNLVMPDARSNALWKEQEDPIAYARGTGFAYALGSHMHVPWCLYDNSQSGRFYGTLEGHQPIFAMMDQHADFFDAYVEPLWAVLEVPYGEDGVLSIRALENRLGDYFDAGVPVLIRLRDQHLFDLQTATYEKEQLKELDRKRFGMDRFIGAPISVETLDSLNQPQLFERPFEWDSSYSEAFYPPVPRVSAEASTAPVVLHLIRRVSQQSPARQARLSISPEFLGGAEVVGVDLIGPAWDGAAIPSVDWELSANGTLELDLKNVAGWGVLRLRTSAPLALPRTERPSFRVQMPESDVPLMRMIRFDNRWARPLWVDELLASEIDPLDGYHVDRISWSYDQTPGTVGYANQAGWDFHGSIGLLHAWMSSPDTTISRGGDILKFPEDWGGWARYPNGRPMQIRPDWYPTRFGASFATPEYEESIVGRVGEWRDLGVAGIQFDDVSGMLNRVWQYGGDFSDALFLLLRDYAVEHSVAGVQADTPLEDLRERVIQESGWTNAAQMVDATPPGSAAGERWLAVPYQATSRGYPGQVWITSPLLEARDDTVIANWQLRFPKSSPAHADFRWGNEAGSSWFARISLRRGTVIHPQGETSNIAVPRGEWIDFRMAVDRGHQRFRYAVGQLPWSDWFPFQLQGDGIPSAGRFNIMSDPLRSGIEIKSLVISHATDIESE